MKILNLLNELMQLKAFKFYTKLLVHVQEAIFFLPLSSAM